jgi:methionyl-tRNA formyltransferase
VRLVFFGTPDFAVPTLARLIASEHEVVTVVSQPDRGRGRGRTVTPSPVSRLALEAELPLLRPPRVAAPEVVAALCDHRPDLGVVVAFGQFLPRSLRELPTRGYLVNAHASLLPRHRGAAPIAHAILAGDRETGICVMRVEREMDAGPVALTRRLAIGAEETCGELTARLSELAADAIAEALAAIAADRATWTPQDDSQATLAPKIEASDARLDWREPAAALVRRVRAMAPAPGAHTRLAELRLLVLAARAEPGPVDRSPGSVRAASGEPLRVATGDGWLLPLRLQRAGGRALDVDEFLRGRPIPDGARLGEDDPGAH